MWTTTPLTRELVRPRGPGDALTGEPRVPEALAAVGPVSEFTFVDFVQIGEEVGKQVGRSVSELHVYCPT